MKKIIYFIFIITIIWFVIQNNGLKDTLNKKDEQINQLLENVKEAETNQFNALDKLNHDYIYEFFSASTEKEKYEFGKEVMTNEALQKLFPKDHEENHSYEGKSIAVKYLESYTKAVSKEEEIYLNLITLYSKAAEEQKVIVKTIYILVDGNWKLKDLFIEGQN
ncbi:hypothetical protein WKH57_01780 [Niallia taxi]|uniref:hypothetical protein n=1 Tax=Niallia taxi TaxID=2499688 RepID=UPI00317FD005